MFIFWLGRIFQNLVFLESNGQYCTGGIPMKLPIKITFAGALLALVLACTISATAGDWYNKNGNILIADQFNNRVLEVNPQTNEVIWSFGDGSSTPGPTSVVAPNDFQRIGETNLVAGTGAPPGGEPNCPNGCADNRVMLIAQNGKIVWQYGTAGVTGSGFNQLNTPVQNTYLPNGDILITDQGNQRVIEVNREQQIVWQQGMTGVAGALYNQLNNPNSAELLANGNILIADESNNRVIEVTRAHNIVWHYGGPNSSKLNGSAFASRLPNGNTLITDANNNRILEVTPSSQVAWEYVTNNRPGSVAAPQPTRAVRLKNGNTLISDQFNDQVIEVDVNGNIVFSQGQIAVPGTGFNELNAPYDAKVVGDYTGLTAP
jgi:outer membrane protein assembly factor BamB